MGRFHRHDDGTVHTHEHDHLPHEHDHGDHSGYETGKQRIDVLEGRRASALLTRDGRCTGVVLDNGERLHAPIHAANPKAQEAQEGQ